MERAHSVIDQPTLKEGDLHKLAKDTEDAEAAGLRRIFDDVVQIENRFWAGLDKVPEPVSIDNPTGDKLTDTATVQTIKASLRRQHKRMLYSEAAERLLSERHSGPEGEPLNFCDFQDVYRHVLSNCQDLVGWTPLHWAAHCGAAGAVQCLLEQKAEVNMATADDNFAPAHEAARAGQLDCLKLLSAAGASMEAATVNGNTPMHYAAVYGHVAVLQFLYLQDESPKKTRLMTKNQMAWTPFHSAARHGQLAAAEIIHQMGGLSLDPDVLGQTPRMLAEANGHMNIVALIDSPPADEGEEEK